MGIGESPLASYLPHSPARGSGLAFLPPLALTLTFLAAPAASQAPDYVLEQHLTGYSRSGGCAVVGDLDGDGDRDVVSASYGKDQIIWYENRGGSPVEFGVPHVVSDTSIGQGPIILADVDGDGDPDIVSASRNDDLIVWYENLDGSNDFGAQRTITTRADGTCTIVAGDVDGDGDLDLASASEFDSKVAWYENLDGQGKFGDQQVIAVSLTMAVGCELADLDGDGDLDIVFSWFLNDTVLWYENSDGQGTFTPAANVTLAVQRPLSIQALDVDGDGDQDLLTTSAVHCEVAWFENLPGPGQFGPKQVVSTIPGAGNTPAHVVDFDRDGDPDVLAGDSGADLYWFENQGGAGGFGPAQLLTDQLQGLSSVDSADFDGDGDRDILCSTLGWNRISWLENLDGAGTMSPLHALTTRAANVNEICVADLDGDGDLDALSASISDNKIAWYENLDGDGDFSRERIVDDQLVSVETVAAGDLDSDGDVDILSASRLLDTLVWYENMDGQGNFSPAILISNVQDAPVRVRTADFDGDGDLDVICVSFQDSECAWYENTDGQGHFGARHVISSQLLGLLDLDVTDLDGDGDQDVLVPSYWADEVYWFENIGGTGIFGPQRLVTSAAGYPRDIRGADVDGDGDGDVIIAEAGGGALSWYENVDGAGSFGPAQRIDDGISGPAAIALADLDFDGDLDLAAASQYDNTISWYENLDGLGAFGASRLVTSNANGAIDVVPADFDGDGDHDLLVAADYDGYVSWWRKSGSPTQASATFRNGGANPASYLATTLPILGTDYSATVDVGSTGNAMAALAGYRAPHSFSLGSGQHVLVDLSSPEYLGFPIMLGPTARFSVAIPDDVTYLGYRIYTQAAHFGGPTPFLLSNAQDLVIGF